MGDACFLVSTWPSPCLLWAFAEETFCFPHNKLYFKMPPLAPRKAELDASGLLGVEAGVGPGKHIDLTGHLERCLGQGHVWQGANRQGDDMPLSFLPPVNQKRWQGLWGTRLPGPELELSKLRTAAVRTAPNPYYCQVGLGLAQSWPLPPGLTEISPANVTLLR